MEEERRTLEILTPLLRKLEECCNRKMKTPKDFDFLADSIFQETHQMVNSSTLKRMYGYVGNVVFPRESTLDILCQYIGYTSWAIYKEQNLSKLEIESNPIYSTHLYSDELAKGEMLRVLWQPDRELLIRHEGSGTFVIVEARNSKLQAGCTFCCHVFIQNEPLYITNVIGLTPNPVDYVCGKSNGVKYF